MEVAERDDILSEITRLQDKFGEALPEATTRMERLEAFSAAVPSKLQAISTIVEDHDDALTRTSKATHESANASESVTQQPRDIEELISFEVMRHMNQLREELSKLAVFAAEETMAASANAAAATAAAAAAVSAQPPQLPAGSANPLHRLRALCAPPSREAHSCSLSALPASNFHQRRAPWLCALPSRGWQACTPPRAQSSLSTSPTQPQAIEPAACSNTAGTDHHGQRILRALVASPVPLPAKAASESDDRVHGVVPQERRVLQGMAPKLAGKVSGIVSALNQLSTEQLPSGQQQPRTQSRTQSRPMLSPKDRQRSQEPCMSCRNSVSLCAASTMHNMGRPATVRPWRCPQRLDAMSS